jgi:hypothetical protein
MNGSDLLIVDNEDKDWRVAEYLNEWCEISSAIDIATGHFEIGGLLELQGKWQSVDKIRIMKEIDQVIEQHGGWLGAFQTARDTTSAPVEYNYDERTPKAAKGTLFED